MCYLCCLSLLVFDVTRCSVYCLVDWWSLCLAAGDTVAAPCLWQCHGEPSLHPRAQGSHWHGGWWEGKPCCVEARTFTEHLLLSLWFILKVVLVDPTMPTHLPSQMSPPHPHPCNKWGEAVPDKKNLTHVTKYSQQDKLLPCLLDSHPAEELFNQVAKSSGEV